MPQQTPLPGRELLDPLLPGFHLIPPGRDEHGTPQLAADRRQPGLFQLRQLASRSLDRIDQGEKILRVEALQRETIQIGTRHSATRRGSPPARAVPVAPAGEQIARPYRSR